MPIRKTVITGLGLTGVALGFALRDIISNFVSRILILMLRPFHIGDQIVVGETEGSVERIVLRATQIRTYDGWRVLVPNADVFTSKVTNNTASPVSRGAVQVYVSYDVDLQHAFNIVREATRRAPGVRAKPDPAVQVHELTHRRSRSRHVAGLIRAEPTLLRRLRRCGRRSFLR